MSLMAATSGFIVLLLSVQVIQGQYSWGVTYTPTEICAVKGSTVEIRCSYRYPSSTYGRHITVEKTFWFKKIYPYEPVDLKTVSEYSGRVQYDCNVNVCTLRISDLRESDSAVYKFRFTTNQPNYYTGEPGVTLSVTDLQVSRPYNDWLECQNSCVPDRSSFIWYKNGQEIQAEASYRVGSPFYKVSYNNFDSYSCAVKGYEDFPSPPACVDGQTCNRVTYTHRNICAFKGSSVYISCSYYNNDYLVSKFWFSPKRKDQWRNPTQPEDLSKDPQYAGRAQVDTWGGRSTLRISDLRESDSAQYHFKFRTPRFEWNSSLPGTTLTVTALQVQITRVSVSQSNTSAELKCHSSCSPADRLSYVWFKNKVKIPGEDKSSYRAWFGLRDNISCAIKGHERFPSTSVYAPKLPSVSVSPSAEIVEGRSVTLTCSSDANPAATYTWYKENVQFQPSSEEPQLVFSSLKPSDSGQYYCAAENELGRRRSNYFTIDVKYAPKRPSVSVSPSGEIVEGSSVNLTCSSDANPAANYTWYKENKKVLQGSDGVYRFISISSEDRGTYHCTSENPHGQINSSSHFIDVQYAPKRPSVSVSPPEVVEGSSVNLTCNSDANPAATFTWYKENQTLLHEPQNIYLFPKISSKDSGFYHCKSENKYSKINSTAVHIDVQYAPKLPSVSVSPSAEIMEGSSVNLTCSGDANPAATYTWYKENEDSRKASGQIFTITDIRPEHSGNYYCEAKNIRGRHNSTFHPIIVSRSMKSVAAGSITAVLLVIIFLLAFLFIRRKRSLKQTSRSRQRPDDEAQVNLGVVYDTPSAPRQRPPSEQQGELCYDSVRFFKNQEDPLYSNIVLNQPNRHKEEEEDEDDVEYTVVNFNSASAATASRREDAEEDSSALYSTVIKKPRV